MSGRRFTLHPHEEAAIAGWLEPGLHADLLGDPDLMRAWSVLTRGPGWVLLEHWNGALARVEVEGDRVVGHRLLLGEAARDEAARHRAT